MKWLVVASLFLCFTFTLIKGSALKCQPGSEDAQCLSENTEKVPETTPSINISERKEHKWTECLAGSEWESKCHRCRCSADGHPECSRMDTCEKGEYGEPIRCKPRTTFKNVCNTCNCLENGAVICTLMECLSFQSTLGMLAAKEKRKDCLPGSRWKSKCNECFCSDNGRSVCTDRACLDQKDEPEMACAPETSWQSDCNTCWCDNGHVACTRIGCAQHIVNDFKPFHAQTTTERSVSEPDQAINADERKLIKRSALCESNISFKENCNNCKCATDGQSYSCTTHECKEPDVNEDVEVFMETEGADHIERNSVCKPQGVFTIGCNTCQCSVDGMAFSCTNKPCPLPKDVEIFHELRELRTSASQKVVCTANRMFIKDCNTCWCNEDGTSYFCTRKVCITELPEEITEDKPENLQEIKRKCRPDEVFELDCNMCRCNPDGLSFSCTRRACVPEEMGKSVSFHRRIRATAQGTPKACQPGLEFRMDCNKCLCDNEGQNYSCTRIDCAALNSNGNGGARRKREATTQQVTTECEPESVFDQGCNVCRCEADGKKATCTIKICKGDIPDEKKENNVISPESDPGFRCNPGEQFKRDCNDCTCSADGKSVFCTIRFCDQDITPNL